MVLIRKILHVLTRHRGKLLAATIGAVLAWGVWAERQYTVAEHDNLVTIIHGARFLGVPLEYRSHSTIPTSALPEDVAQRVRAGISVSGSLEADQTLEELGAAAQQCLKVLAKPCPFQTPSAPNLTVEVLSYPEANSVKVSWSEVDARRGAVTYLRLDGSAAGGDCGEPLESVGSCNLSLRHSQTYRFSTVTTVQEAIFESQAVSVTTGPKPEVFVRRGKLTVLKDGPACAVLVRAVGVGSDRSHDGVIEFFDATVSREALEALQSDDAGVVPEQEVGWYFLSDNGAVKGLFELDRAGRVCVVTRVGP